MLDVINPSGSVIVNDWSLTSKSDALRKLATYPAWRLDELFASITHT